jgi:hypothetical protein
MRPSTHAELTPGRNRIGSPTTPTPARGEKLPVTTVAVVRHRRGEISPLASAHYLGRPARVWFEALRPWRSPTATPAPTSAATPRRGGSERFFRRLGSHLPGPPKPTLEELDPPVTSSS